MIRLIKRLFGGAKKPDLAAPSQPDSRAYPSAIEVESQAGTRRELVRMLTRDSQRHAGIPDGWLESQVLLELGRGGQTFIHLRVVVRHWDERLLKYAVAFQRTLRSEIERFEPAAREWLLSITWQYEVDDQCPYPRLPDPGSWTGQAGLAAGPTPAPARIEEKKQDTEEDEVRADLARLFAVRDANMGEQAWEATKHSAMPDFEPTTHSALPPSARTPR